MTYTTIPLDQFGGLDTRDDLRVIGSGGASAMLNVDLDIPGTVRCRDGFTRLNSTAGTASLFFPWGAYDGRILAGTPGNVMTARDTTGVIATGAGISPTGSYANFGTPTTPATYISRIGGSPAKWNGTAFSTPAFTGTDAPGTGSIIDVWLDRLVNCNMSTKPSRISFSDAGDPLTFATNNFVELHPGDGEGFAHQTATWNGSLFVLKTNHLFVFYSVSIDSGGNPIFNYRTVDTPFGTTWAYTLVAGRDGVYALTGNGLYVSTGGPFSLVSTATVPLLQGRVTGFPGFSPNGNAVRSGSRIIFPCTVTAAANAYWLIWDEQVRAWLLWSGLDNCAVTAGSTTISTSIEHLYTILGTGVAIFAFIDPGSTTDNGTAIDWSYVSGAYDLGVAEQKVIRQSALWGSGTATLQIGSDFAAVDTGSALTLGVAPAIAEGRQRTARRGTFFQHKISGTGRASVDRVVHFLRDKREPGAK